MEVLNALYNLRYSCNISSNFKEKNKKFNDFFTNNTI